MQNHTPPWWPRVAVAALMLVLLQFAPLHAQTQSDSADIERAITAERGDLSFAGRARMLLLRRFRAGNHRAARQLLGFMDRRPPDDPAGWLTATERLIAETLIADSLLVRDSARLDRLLSTASITDRQHPSHSDNLHATLRDMLREQAESVTGRFMAWEPAADERRFINLLINHLYIRGLRAQEDLNGRVKDFERAAPGSPLVAIAQRYIRKDYGEADFGAAFSAGYCVGTFDGTLGTAFGSYHGPSLGGELYLYRVTIAGQITFGVADAVREFEARGEAWRSGYSPFINASLCAGYEFRFGRIGVTPLAGLAMQSIRGSDSAGTDDPDAPRTRDRVGLEVGAIIGYRIPSDKGPHIDLRARIGRTSTGLSNYDPLFSGALWYIQLAFALVQRPYEPR